VATPMQPRKPQGVGAPSGDSSPIFGRLSSDLFPEGDYRFHLTIRRAAPSAFFAPHDRTGTVLAERARWLAAEPNRYAALLPEGKALLDEFAALAAEWGVARHPESVGMERLLELGRTVEPDILFLSPGDDGRFRLRAGALCFPTGWALEEKMGMAMDEIHGVVPGLNSALGSPIHLFLSKLKPGAAFLRDNWGIAATDALNLHPARAIPPPIPPVELERLWLRVEHQALVAMPRTGGIVFGIRVVSHRLDEVVRAGFGGQLRRALETMPVQLAAYKRLDAILPDVVRLLT
jgi:hypothetical protein